MSRAKEHQPGADEAPVRLVVGAHVPASARDFQGLRAGIVTRIIANIVDGCVAVSMTLGMYVAWSLVLFMWHPATFAFPRWHFAFSFAAVGAVLVIYLWICWSTTGRSVGNSMMGLRVVGRTGQLMLWSTAFLRAAFCVAFPAGLFWTVASHENRSLQDVVHRSSVIYDWGGPTHMGREEREP